MGLDTQVNEPQTKEEPFPTVKVAELTPDSEKKDDTPPLVDIKVTNPVTYLKRLLKKIFNNEGIKIYVRVRPFTVFLIVVAIAAVFTGTGFSIAKIFFPNSSPILSREISVTGIVKQTDDGAYYLVGDSGVAYRLVSFARARSQYEGKRILIKGNLGKEANSINVSDVLIFDN